ncbi:APC family permease [Haloimpatiens sp. FM7330]|uniref:APC family permease n=1 Tax=Haloimpatiens sp. FM7330 TaxID=3298610 RepID=UPI00362666CC
MTKEKLKKSINLVEAMAIVIGMIIGSGIFLKPAVVFSNAGSSALGIIAWIAGGIISLASALTIAEIAAAIPKTGGLYIYLRELFGDIWGFLLGWVQTVISYPAAVAALAIAFAGFASFFVPLNDIQQKFTAGGILIFLIVMNIIATKFGGIIQTISTVGKLIPVFAIILFGLIKGQSHDITFTAVKQASTSMGLGAAILGTLWAYDGWIGVTNMAGELKNPKRDLPKSIILGVICVMGVYVLFNIALVNVVPMEQIINSKNPVSDIAVKLFGSKGGALIVAGMMISVFGTMNGYLMTGARVPFAMAERKEIPLHKYLGKSHPKFQTPTNSLLLEGLLAVIYIFSGSFDTLSDLIMFVLWIFFVVGVFGIFVLRKKVSPEKRPYKVPLYPITPLVGILGGSYILVSTILNAPLNSFIGIGITLLGLPVFYYLKNHN